MYNTEAVITALLEKNIPTALSHVRGMKDLKKLKLFSNQNYSAVKEVDGEQPARYSCPITKMEFNGNHPFVAIWTTGYVISEKAIKELGIDALQEEYGPFSSDDVVRLIPTSFEIEAQTTLMLARRSKRKAEKADKKSSGSDKVSNDAELVSSKKRKHKENDEAAASASEKHAHGEKVVTSISKSNALVKTAQDAVKAQQDNSKVFKGLFHKDKEADKHDRDLFMSVAGIRYTLG